MTPQANRAIGTMPGRGPCRHCDSSGKVRLVSEKTGAVRYDTCPKCGGSGKLTLRTK